MLILKRFGLLALLLTVGLGAVAMIVLNHRSCPRPGGAPQNPSISLSSQSR